MNSLVISIVAIDGSGNGSGKIKIPMFQNAEVGVTLSGIKVAEGGCIVEGRAELSGVDLALLNAEQRANLEKAYAVFEKATDVIYKHADEIAKTINAITDYFAEIKAKKEATKKLLEESDISMLPEVLANCTEIAAKSQAPKIAYTK